MQMLSVIICTYSPNTETFERCLSSISNAITNNFPLEIIIVDNNSVEPLAKQSYIVRFLERHTYAKVVIEKKQGLTPARLKGIEEAKGDLLVFIDDDNIIASDFFNKGKEIEEKYPMIGAWSGQVLLEFEKEPDSWLHKYQGLLVYRQFQKDCWSNLPLLAETMPCGAGLFIRKAVADYYYHLHKTNKRNIQLDRTGKSLFSGGDNDMAACACDIGLGVGLFHEIVVVHYIPSFRLEKKYLLRLAEGIAASTIVLKYYRGIISNPPSLKNRIATILRIILKKGIDKEFYKAVLKGEKKGRLLIAQN